MPQSLPIPNRIPAQFSIRTSDGETVGLDILMADGPLCVAPVWNWEKKAKVPGLYFVYMKRFGLHFGPYYAGIDLATKDMKRALKAFPQAGFWEQPLEWYARQTAFHDWIKRNMGRPDDLIGGRWEPEEKTANEGAR